MHPLPSLSLSRPSPSLQACVIIPARDESEGIEATLDAFADQRDIQGNALDPASFEILLLANNCRDSTAQLARRWSRSHPRTNLHVIEAQFSKPHACIGYVRRFLMDAACQRFDEVNHSMPTAICSTDADTRVSSFWIAHTLEEMKLGAKAVGGRILLRRENGDSTRRTYLLDTAYRLLSARLQSIIDPRPGDPGPCHFQFFGASLAICPQLYKQVGGLPQVQCLEDVALEQRLSSLDIEIRHSPHVIVWTSARRSGRVQTGLSTQLNEWSGLGSEKQWLVPSGAEIVFQARLRRQLRSYWHSPDDGEARADISKILKLNPIELEQQVRQSCFFGELWERIWRQAWNNTEFRTRFEPIPVENALAELRQMLAGVHEK